ncbi:GTPase IMAP family member 9-like [Oncorhynchus masou masou]|uniref:GTPase IMAP family member 9-like n=1 Tax=Oncorhynchus masou masou TaxID=90313 RepID=UPI0031843687
MSIYESSPGTHAFLIVLRVNDRFTEQEKQAIETLESVFGSGLTKHSIILFTHGDALEGNGLEKLIGGNRDLSRLVEQCGGRYHVLNNKARGNRAQVTKLMEKIDRIVEDNGGTCYTNEMFEEADRIKKEEEERIQREIRERFNMERREMREEEERMQKERECQEEKKQQVQKDTEINEHTIRREEEENQVTGTGQPEHENDPTNQTSALASRSVTQHLPQPTAQATNTKSKFKIFMDKVSARICEALIGAGIGAAIGAGIGYGIGYGVGGGVGCVVGGGVGCVVGGVVGVVGGLIGFGFVRSVAI